LTLLDALRNRRSRRFGLGMEIPDGPLRYKSRHPPRPLSEEHEAALAFAACGVTGYALADLAYGTAQGGQMLTGMLGRTVASPDAIHMSAVCVINDRGAWLLKRPQDFPAHAIPALAELAQKGELTELYRRSRVQLLDRKSVPPVEPGANFNINRWSLYAAGGTYFLPVSELTGLYLNSLLEAFDEASGLFIVDERNLLQPAGLKRFAASKGGHLADDPKQGRLLTVQAAEACMIEAAAVEQGMMLQNLGLMAQTLGLGGFPNFAPHPSTWFEALGFRMDSVAASRYLGMPKALSSLLGLLGKDAVMHYPVGLERNGQPLLQTYTPTYFPRMRDAVEAALQRKERGFRVGGHWKDAPRIPLPSKLAVEAAVAYCEYIVTRYGRFPAYNPPLRTVMGFQATYTDVEFYDRFYRPEALSDAQRELFTAITAPPSP
jgi:hypothetical protein